MEEMFRESGDEEPSSKVLIVGALDNRCAAARLDEEHACATAGAAPRADYFIIVARPVCALHIARMLPLALPEGAPPLLNDGRARKHNEVIALSRLGSARRPTQQLQRAAA